MSAPRAAVPHGADCAGDDVVEAAAQCERVARVRWKNDRILRKIDRDRGRRIGWKRIDDLAVPVGRAVTDTDETEVGEVAVRRDKLDRELGDLLLRVAGVLHVEPVKSHRTPGVRHRDSRAVVRAVGERDRLRRLRHREGRQVHTWQVLLGDICVGDCALEEDVEVLPDDVGENRAGDVHREVDGHRRS